MKAKLCILAVVLLLGAAPALADTTLRSSASLRSTSVWPKTYTFNPFKKSLPTMGNDGDMICQIGNEQAWFCFDISSIPDVEQIISASFTACMLDYSNSPTQRTLWYDPSDAWINDFGDPGNKAVSELVATITLNGDTWTWITTDVDISKHDWSNDVADDYITLMLTGPLSRGHSCGVVDFRGAVLELATIPIHGDTDDDRGLLNLGPEEIVQADGNDIQVPGYSVPSFVDWNNDKLNDLVIGEGGGYGKAKVRIYLNVGTESSPQFSDYFYAQSKGSDLACPASGCLGCFPRVDYWDADERKDLLVGQADGTVKIFLNIGTDENPTFDGGTTLQVGFPPSDLDVGIRATPTAVDWDSDGRKDLVVGAWDGKIHIYLNCGCGGSVPPRFDFSPVAGTFAQEDGRDLVVPSVRSSPVVLDLDGDGRKDLLTGNTDGQLLFYSNVGTDEEPSFAGYKLVDSNDVPIDLPGRPRSRPFVCYWTGDGHFGPIDAYPDVLIGAGDGKVHLYRGIPEIGDMDGDGDVNFADLALFAACWHQTGSAQCAGADFTGDGKVGVDDLRRFAENWLMGAE